MCTVFKLLNINRLHVLLILRTVNVNRTYEIDFAVNTLPLFLIRSTAKEFRGGMQTLVILKSFY